MNLRSIVFAALLAPLPLMWSCSGAAGGPHVPQPSCGSSSNFCLVSCNLGCDLSGVCAVSSIAQNQPIELHFSDQVDPATVTAATVSLKTANGETPSGRFVVDGTTLVFVPEVRIAGGVTTFGFRAGATYVLSLNASATGGVLSSVSGARLARSVVCSLQITQGLVDLDGKPPEAELILPATETGVARDSSIVLRFSELIDVSSFNGASTIASPITYQIRRTVPDPLDPNVRICESGFQPVLVQGVPVASVEGSSPPHTVITLQPSTQLPNRVCVEVILTAQVRDLAGNPAVRKTFRFYTEVGTVQPQAITESFANEANLDRNISGGTWIGGRATPARLGGSGVLGSFNYQTGTLQAGTTDTYLFDTGNYTVPANSTLFGTSNITVNDGKFDFTDFVVPSGVKVQFRGAFPAVIRVRGLVDIQGEVRSNGSAPASNFAGQGVVPNTPIAGQAGAAGGAGAGSGGQGADGVRGNLGANASNTGRAGQDCRPPATSGYAGLVAGSGGPGSPPFPANGLNTSVTYTYFGAISAQATSGGSGGSFLGLGEVGHVVHTFAGGGGEFQVDHGPDSAPGVVVPITALPPGISSLDHFLVGGSGGGGGGSHPSSMLNSNITSLLTWTAGAGGAGGGGAMAFRVGHEFNVHTGGKVAVVGGGGATHTVGNLPPPAPGGGGSGGSLIVQIENDVHFVQSGSLDVSGGPRGVTDALRVSSNVNTYGGKGGYGAVREETNTPITTAQLGTVTGPTSIPAEFIGALDSAEGDAQTGFTSRWRSSRQLFAPLWTHYVLTCRIRGNVVVYSDDPANFNPADSDTLPVRIYFQGADVNATTGTITGEPGPWRNYVNGQSGRLSINTDDATGCRFMIVFNRTVETDVQIEDLEIVYES